MPKGTEGLRLGASARTVALADMKAGDIIAGLSAEQKTELAAALNPTQAETPAPQPKAEDTSDGEDTGKKKDKKDKETPQAADPKPAPAADAATIRAEERQRMADVFASNDVKGREQAAVMLLTETDMSAEKIVAKLPTLSPASADSMLSNLRGDNPNLGAGDETETDTKAAAGSVWDRTFEANGWNK